MAEEVKIVDVAGGPAAEATLQELLKVTRSMAAKAGKDSGGVENKTQQMYNRAVAEGTTAKRGFIKEVKAGASALKSLAGVVGSIIKGVFGAFTSIIGYGIGIATTLFKAFGDGTGTLTDMVGQIPIFGSLLASLTGIFDDTLKTFQGLSTSGASFNNNLTELRVAAAGAKVSLDSFASLIGSNTEKFAALGGTVTQGAQNFVKVRKAMGAYEQQLLGMGLTFEDINEGLMDYMTLQRTGSRVQQRDVGKLAQHSAEYTKSLMTLSKLTGQDVKTLKEKQMAEQNDLAFQLAKGKLTIEAQAKLTQALLDAAVGGPAAIARVKEEFLGFPPMTRDTKLFAATMGDANKAIVERAAAVRNESISSDQFLEGQANAQARIVAGMLSSAKNMETVLTAGSLSGEGVGNEILQMLQASGVDLSKYIGKTGNDLVQAVEADIKLAKAEGKNRDDMVKALTDFQSTLRNIKESIEINFIAPIANLLAPQLTKLSNSFKDADNKILKPAMERIGRVLNTFLTDINTVGFEAAFKNIFEKMKSAVAKLISGDKTTKLGEAVMGLVGDAFKSLASAMLDGFVSMFTNPKVIAGLVAAVATMFVIGKAKSALSNMMGGGAGETLGPTRASRTAGGKVGSNVGGAIGGLGGGIIEGLGNGLAGVGAKAPLVIAGAAAIGTAIGLIGAGIAGAAFLTGKALPKLSEGIKSFEQLDGARLSESGKGMAAVAVGMAAFGAGSAVAGLGSLVGSITQGISGLFGAEDPMVKMQKFAEYNINGVRVKNNAEALVAFSSAMASSGGAGAASGIGAAANAIGSAIAGFFGGNKGLPYDEIIKFSSYTFDTTKIKTNAEALVAFNQALSASAGAQAASGGGSAIAAIGGAISKFFGAETPFEQVKAFGDLKLNADGVRNNATAMTAMYTALSTMSGSGSLKDVEIPKALVSRIRELSDITGGGLPTVAAGMESIGKVQGFKTNLDALKNGLDVQSVTSYTSAMAKLVTTLDDLNKVLANDNKGMFGGGSKVSAADVIKAGSSSGKGSDEHLQKLDLLNTTMVQVLATLQEGTEYGRRTSKAIRANGNLQLGV